MDLFGKKKDLILKITNMVLCIWLIGSVTIFYMNVVNYFLKEPIMTYDEYRASRCYFAKDLAGEDADYCANQYQNYLGSDSIDDVNKKKMLFTSFGSIIIVSVTLYFLNKRKGDAK